MATGKRQAMSRSSIHGAWVTTKFFRDGEAFGIRETDVSAFPSDIVVKLASYGFAAASKNHLYGLTGEPDANYDSFIARLCSGDWTPGHTPSEPKEQGPSVLALAYERYEAAQHKKNPQVEIHSLPEIMERLAELSPVQKRQLRSSEALAPHVKFIETQQGKTREQPNVVGLLFGAPPQAQAAE